MNLIFKFLVIGLSALFLMICTLLFLTYVVPTNSPIVKKFSRILPAVIVDGKVVTVGAILENTTATRTFYEKQNLAESGIRVDYTTPDGQKRLKIIEKEIVNKLTEGAVIEKIVDAQGLHVGKEDVAMALSRTLKEGGDIRLAQDRVGLYGWSLEEFARKVIKPSLYEERLEKSFREKNAASQEMLTKIGTAKQMIDDGREFAEVAKTYSEGTAASRGGAQGLYRKEQLDPSIADEAFSLEVGEVSDVFESPYGLHIFMLDDVILDENDVKDVVSLNHIYVSKVQFADYIGQEIAVRKVRVLLPEYVWSSDENLIVFADADMRSHERDELDKAYEQARLDAADIAQEKVLLSEETLDAEEIESATAPSENVGQ